MSSPHSGHRPCPCQDYSTREATSSRDMHRDIVSLKLAHPNTEKPENIKLDKGEIPSAPPGLPEVKKTKTSLQGKLVRAEQAGR